MIQIIDSIEPFKELESEWDFLFNNAANVTFFQTFRYNWIAWKNFSTEKDNLHILLEYSGDGELHAIFPFYIDSKKRLRFINDRHTDFCNAIISKEIISVYSIMHDVWKSIEEDKSIKTVLMDNVLQTSPILSYWKVFCGNAFVFSQTEHSWLVCKKSENIFNDFKHLNSKERKRLIKLDKQSRQCDMTVYNISNSPYPEHIVNAIVEQMTASGLRSSSYLNDSMRTFMRELYESGLVELPILCKNGEPMALSFIFANDQKTFGMRWVTLYKSKEYNLWHNVRYMSTKAEYCDSVVDFGRGGYDYKMSNFHPQVENLYRFMASNTKWGNCYILMRIAASHIRKTLKKYRTR